MVCDRSGSDWGKATYLRGEVNSGRSQLHATATQKNTLYFQAIRDEGYGKADIYRSSLIDGIYQTPENLGPVINSENYEGDVFVAKDESYLIVSIYGREDDMGGGDLYISFRNDNDVRSPLKNMGTINSDQRDFCPMLSPDGKYFFFSSKRTGANDIYWVDAKVINLLRGD